MKRSESQKLLIAALAQFQAEVNPVPKTSENTFFKSKYADLATIVEHTRRLLTEKGLLVSQFPGIDDGKPTLVTVLAHVSGEWMESETPLKLAKDDPQAQGSAITYMRRYAYCACLGIVADDDDDAEKAMRRGVPAVADPKHTSYAAPIQEGFEMINGERIPTAAAPPITRTGPPSDLATPKQVGYARSLIEAAGIGDADGDAAQAWINANCPPWPGMFKNLSKKQASTVIELLK